MHFPLVECRERWTRIHASLAEAGLESAVVLSRSAGTHEKDGELQVEDTFGTTTTDPTFVFGVTWRMGGP